MEEVGIEVGGIGSRQLVLLKDILTWDPAGVALVRMHFIRTEVVEFSTLRKFIVGEFLQHWPGKTLKQR